MVPSKKAISWARMLAYSRHRSRATIRSPMTPWIVTRTKPARIPASVTTTAMSIQRLIAGIRSAAGTDGSTRRSYALATTSGVTMVVASAMIMRTSDRTSMPISGPAIRRSLATEGLDASGAPLLVAASPGW